MKDVSIAQTAQECMEMAELDYQLQLQPLYIGGNNKVDGIPVQGKQVQGKQAVVRLDNGEPIGVVGNQYKIVQNAEVFSFFDGIVEQGLGTYKKAYCAKGGAKVNVICDLGPVQIGPDSCRKELVLRTSHDGSCAVTGIMRIMRLICTNGLMSIKKQNSIKIRHTANYQLKMAQAKKTLGIARQYYHWFATEAEKLYHKPVSPTYAWDIITKKFMPAKDENKVSTRLANAWDDVFVRFVSGKGNHGENYWDLYNGLTEHVDHFRSRNRNEEQSLETNLVGSGAGLKERAFEVLTGE
jgi:phage/plasmid-like protein (TIGR03299 family)